MNLLLLVVLAAHAGQGEALSPLSIATQEPAAVEYARGYFEYRDGKWIEDHRNTFERGVYDAAGKLIGVVEVGLVDSTVKVKQSFDAAGRVTDVTYFAAGNFHGRKTFAYDAQGRLNETLFYDDEGKLIEKRQQAYSKRGLLAVESVFKRVKGSEDLALTEEEQFTYDKAGKPVSRTTSVIAPKKYVRLVTGYGAGGTVATEQTFNEWGDAKEAFVYSYESDPKLGWSKELKMRQNGKLAPVDVIYRKLVPIKR